MYDPERPRSWDNHPDHDVYGPEPGLPMWHGLTCSACGNPHSHTDPLVTRCGLCRMDAVNAYYRERRRRDVYVRAA